MADYILSSNMSMPVPVPGVDPGPDWATNLNQCLTILDGHDHTAGNGVPITPSAININVDLPFNSFNAISLRSARFTSQTAVLALASDLRCLYVVSSDLYYNDGSGTNIRITQSGAVAGTPGSIANLVSPASATYVSATPAFVFQSDANTAANIDGGSVILRNLTSGSFGLTLSPPTLGSDYSIVLPTLPAATHFLSIDNSGNIGSAWVVDNSTLEVSSNTVQVKNGGITPQKLAALGQQISSSCGNFNTASTGVVDVTNLSITITTTGRPVWVGLITDNSLDGTFGAYSGSGGVEEVGAAAYILRGATLVCATKTRIDAHQTTTGFIEIESPVGSIFTIDPVGAGTYTYKVQMQRAASGAQNIFMSGAKLIAYEL